MSKASNRRCVPQAVDLGDPENIKSAVNELRWVIFHKRKEVRRLEDIYRTLERWSK